ncbi:ARF guanine-nucleotide exchange factor GNL2 [Vitis vinifera]|uniref:ARF guanine-nucleotide exchange factor GNL2 n=1 Tax=Vitis vinifera TaxID=29760 RepID=A0A438JQ49_VITVI|nr:ARF guanine-nucleotide exchange factor GNL2 [Vitis vinifera]
MEKTRDDNGEEEEEENKPKNVRELRRRELGLSCMLNTEVGAVLAVIRRPSDTNSQFLAAQEDNFDSSLLHSLKSLRALIFNPQQEWRTIDPSIYLAPFLDVVQSDDVPATATGVALSAIFMILKLEIFDEKTPGARDAVNSIVTGITTCRLERTDPISEDAILMKILHVLTEIMKKRASILLTDHAVCTIVNTCFQVVQQSAIRGDLLQRGARHTMQELIQTIFSRFPEINKDRDKSLNDFQDGDINNEMESGYGVRSAVDIFSFLCSLLNVVEVVDMDGSQVQTADEDVQLFALVLINSAIQLSGDEIGSSQSF